MGPEIIGGWGVLIQPGNPNGSCERDSVAGEFFEISGPRARRGSVPFRGLLAIRVGFKAKCF